jgi:hypothetical protein
MPDCRPLLFNISRGAIDPPPKTNDKSLEDSANLPDPDIIAAAVTQPERRGRAFP